MSLSIDDLVDKDFHTYSQLKSLKKNFLDQDEIFLVIRRKDGKLPSKQQICSISNWTWKIGETRGDIKAIVSTLGIQWPTETTNHFTVNPILGPDCTRKDIDETSTITASFKKIGDSPWKGTLTADKADDLAILFYPRKLKKKNFLGSFDPKVVSSLKKDFENNILKKHPNLQASWIGDGVFQFHLFKGYEFMPILNLLMSLFIIIFMRLYLGSFLSSTVFLSLITWISLPIYAGMALFGHPIDVLSSSLSLMVFVASLEDFLFLSHYLRSYSWKNSFRKLILPSFLTSLTTMIGFGSLMFAELEAIRRFGFWAAIAAGLEWIALFVVLPAILIKFPKFSLWVNNKKSIQLKFNFPLQFRPNKIITYFLLVAFPLGIYATQKLQVSDSPENLLDKSHQARQDLNLIEETRGWRAQLSLVFKDHDRISFNKKIIKQTRSWKFVDQIEDPYSVNEYLTKDLSVSIKSYFSNLIESDVIGHRLGPVGLSSRAIVYVKGLDIVDINKMRKKIDKICPKQQCWLAGSLVSYGEFGGRVLGTLYKSLGGSLALVVFILFLLSLSYRPSAFIPLCLSAMWGPLALLSVFYIFNIPVFYATSMVASILVGLAGDNAIHYLFSSQKQKSTQEAVKKLAPVSLLICAAMMIACTVFFFGYFAPMKSLGLMLIVGLALSVVGDIWILRGLDRKPS